MRWCALLTAALLAAMPTTAAEAAGQGGVAPDAAPAPAMVQDAACHQFIARCRVDGRPARLMVDTGATHTVLAEDFVARELPEIEKLEGVRLAGNAAVQPVPALARVQAGETELAKSLVLILDLGGVNSMMAEPIDGILGMAQLGQLSFTLDLRSGTGAWEAAETAPAGMELQRLEGKPDPFGRLYLPARSGNHGCLLLLDSGSSSTTWPLGQWAAGSEEAAGLHVADVNGARAECTVQRGLPAPLELAGGIVLPRVSPLLQSRENGHLLGLDALKGCLLLHRPNQGFYLARSKPAAP